MSQYKELQKRINGALVALSQAAEARNATVPTTKDQGAHASTGASEAADLNGLTQKDIDKLVNENAVFTNRNRVLQRKLEEQEVAFKSLSRSLAQFDEKQKTLQAQLTEIAALQASSQVGQSDVDEAVNSMLATENARLQAFKDEAAVVLAALNTALAGQQESPSDHEGA